MCVFLSAGLEPISRGDSLFGTCSLVYHLSPGHVELTANVVVIVVGEGGDVRSAQPL